MSKREQVAAANQNESGKAKHKISAAEQAASEAKLENEELRKHLAEFEKSR